jgi:hypothetical protein
VLSKQSRRVTAAAKQQAKDIGLKVIGLIEITISRPVSFVLPRNTNAAYAAATDNDTDGNVVVRTGVWDADGTVVCRFPMLDG